MVSPTPLEKPQMWTCPSGRTLAYHRFDPAAEGGVATSPVGVVFLHGLMSDMNGGKALHVEAHCRQRGWSMLRFDQSGHGQSEGRFIDGTIGGWAEDTCAMIDALTTGPQIVIGSSMGGWVMLLTALKRQDRVAGLLGIAPAPDFTEDLTWPALTPAQQAEVMETGTVAVPSAYSDEPYRFSRALFDDGRRNCLLGAPIPFAGPVRILHGQQDEAVPWQHALRIADRLTTTDVEITFIKGGDHRLSEPAHLDRLSQTLDALHAAVSTG